MRPIRSVLLPLGFLIASIGSAAAQNVCVQGADGAIVCGPVANRGGNPAQSPFDQPAQNNIAPSNNPAPPVAVPPRPLPNRAVREVNRDVPPPRRLARPLPPRELDRRPPPSRQVAREDARRLQAERHAPPPRVDRVRSARYSEPERRRVEERRERVVVRADRDPAARRYDARLRELEREVRVLRAEREDALRRGPDRRPAVRPVYRERAPGDADRDIRARERLAVSQRTKRVDRDRDE